MPASSPPRTSDPARAGAAHSGNPGTCAHAAAPGRDALAHPWLAALVLVALGASGCSREAASPSPVPLPGAPAAFSTRMLDAGAQVLQDRQPIDAIHSYLNGFHFYSGRLDAQMEAHHYCTLLNEEVIQCVLFDGNQRGARMTGVEYIISARLFARLPAAEKPLWHSHVHEVRSGQLRAPGIPAFAETRLMERLVGTYGKTWHTWHTDAGESLPLGVPQLMMGFTADGQLNPALLARRDARLESDSAAVRARRAALPAPAPDPAADAWQHGAAFQIPPPGGPSASHGAPAAPAAPAAVPQ